jgi:hypothetical protein
VHAEDRFPVAEVEAGQRPGRGGLGGGGPDRPEEGDGDGEDQDEAAHGEVFIETEEGIRVWA